MPPDVQYVSHNFHIKTAPGQPDLSNQTLAPEYGSYPDGQFFKQKIRWLVFKVKQRAERDLNRVRLESLPGVRNDKKVTNWHNFHDSAYFYEHPFVAHPDIARTSQGRMNERLPYSYNWPYDYFSFVELVKIDTKVDFLPSKD